MQNNLLLGYWYQYGAQCAQANPNSVSFFDSGAPDSCTNPDWTLCRGADPVIQTNTTETVYNWTSTTDAFTETSYTSTLTDYFTTDTVTETTTETTTTYSSTLTINDNVFATTTVTVTETHHRPHYSYHHRD